MQFTPQQLQGGPRFSSSVRIGNWQEELVVEEAKLESFRKRAASGSLSLRKQQAKLTKCNEIVPHTFSPDGLIRFGDSIILSQDATGSILACDPTEEIIAGHSKFLVTTYAGHPEPKARNIFRVVRPPSHLRGIEDDENDPIVRIGQSFCLACSESLLVQENSNILAPTLYLCSTKKNERNATKTTNRQLVYMSPNNDADSVWLAIKPSFGKVKSLERYLSNGMPLTVNDAVQITHRQTNMYITCDPHQSMKSEFGIEYECYADRSVACGKLSLIVSEFKGVSTVQTLAKPDAPQFAWHFVTSSDEASAIDNRILPPPATVDVLLSKMREYIKSRGVDAYWNMRNFFQELEAKSMGDGKMDREDVKEALLTWGCPFEGRYLDSILDLKDHKKLGLIDYSELIALLKGSFPLERRDICEKVYAKLDRYQENAIPIEELKAAFVGSTHPLVSLGGFSEADAFEHLKRAMTKKTSRGRTMTAVPLDSFVQYYSDLSATIEDDAYFEDIVRGNWSL